jgi:hypothetical protein
MDGIVRFHQGGDCVFLAEADILKLYQPQSARRIGGRSVDRVLGGYIGFALRSEVGLGLSSQRRAARPPSLSLCPVMNFQEIVRASALVDGEISTEFADAIRRHLNALPSTLDDVERGFGAGFFTLEPFERVPIMADFLWRVVGR